MLSQSSDTGQSSAVKELLAQLEAERALRGKQEREHALEMDQLIAAHQAAQRLVEEELSEARQAWDSLCQAHRVREKFFQGLTNELRTPMNGILGMLRLALRPGVDETCASFIRSAVCSAEELLGVLNDLLDIGKLESGSLDLEPSLVDLRKLMHQVFDQFESAALRKSLTPLYEVDQELPDVVETDPKRLAQVLRNLFSNAVKFSERGQVSLSARVICSMDLATEIQFSVRDNGPGLDLDQQSQLFQAFRRGHSAPRRAGGSGLGLAISSRLVEMMGGYLNVESMPGEGSCFSFSLGFVHHPQLPSLLTPRSSGPFVSTVEEIEHMDSVELSEPRQLNDSTLVQIAPRVLLVEEDEVNRIYESTVLREAGCDVVAVCNGQSAMEMLESQHFDVLMLELQIPHLDGIEVTRRVRAAERAGTLSKIAIIALTSQVLESDRARCLAVGMDGYLTKPVDREQILEALRQAIPSAALSAVEASSHCEGFKVESLLKKLGSVENLQLMAGLFSRRYPEHLGELLLAVSRQDGLALQRAIHNFRSVFLSMGTTHPLGYLKELEFALSRDSWDVMAGRLERLRESCRALEELMGSYVFTSHDHGAGSATSHCEEETATVLVIDDDPATRFLIGTVLRRKGHLVLEAKSGKEGLELLKERSVDTILLDVLMPDLDGNEVCRRVKNQLRTRKIPVLLISGVGTMEARIDGIEAGADDFLTKPFDTKEMVFRVRNACRQKKMVDRLERSFEQLQKTESLRDELAHMLVHDLRSPLAGVMGYAQMLLAREAEGLNPRQARFAKQIAALSRMLNEMVSAILDVSRLEADELPLSLARCDLSEIAIAEGERFQGLPGPTVRVQATEPVLVECDSALVQRVLSNLLANAFNYSSQGQDVWLRVSATEEGARAEVVDQGPGVPAGMREKIFDKFAQVEDARGRRAYSSGLGLTFCRLVLERHGGRIGVDSEEGKGSTFWFVLPADRS